MSNNKSIELLNIIINMNTNNNIKIFYIKIKNEH